MSKITISSIGSGYSRSKINDAVQDITTELNNKVLYRDNPTGEPNQLEQELDMNSNVIANAKDIHTERLKLNGQWISANNLSTLEADSINYDNTSSLLTATSVQDAIDEVEGRTDTAETNITNASDRLDTNELAITAAEGRLDINEPAITAVEGRLDNVGDESVTTSTGTQTVETALDNRLISNTADDVAGTAALLNTGTDGGELPTNDDLGTAAVTDADAYATSAQGDTADSALQSTAIGVSVQAQSTVLDNTTASFTTAKDSKLTGIEVGATTDQTDSEIKTAYEANLDTNAFTDSEQIKLGNIEENATADQSDSEIKTAYESNADTNEFSDAEQTKLSGIEDNATADQTKADIDGLEVDAGTLEGNAASAFATSAQGDTADSALQSADAGTASTKDTGTAPDEVPLNSSLVPKSGGTFTGDIAATNLSGTNTGDQDLSGKADIAGQVFTGDITYYGGGGVSTNTSYGTGALESNTTGNNNTAHGYQALYSNTEGSYNTASGYQALTSNTRGDNNVANGYQALYFNTTGDNNTAHGYQALYSNTTAFNNTANGYQALYFNTIGFNNTASGYQALYSNTEGIRNTANGYHALFSNTTGDRNTAHGYQALYSNTTAFNNTATGRGALFSNTTGDRNTANGYNALVNNTTGERNTANGVFALAFSGSYDNVSGLGYDAQVTGSNQVSLGDSNTTVYTQSGSVSSRSDLRDKADVRDTILGLDFITALRPVDYRWDQREDYKPDAPTRPEPLNNDATEQEIEAHELALSQYENDHAEWLIAVKHENLMHDGTHTRTRYHHGIIAQEIAEVIAESGVDFGG